MCLEAVDKVVKDPVLLRLFRIPSDLWPAVRVSWGATPNPNTANGYSYETLSNSRK
jgi:glutathionylspermidine synthase